MKPSSRTICREAARISSMSVRSGVVILTPLYSCIIQLNAGATSRAATIQELGVMGEPTNRAKGTTADRMKGKVCLVTGGGSGIGRATALKMAEEGAAAVLIGGRREAEIESAAAECRTLGSQSFAIRTDVTRENDVERLVGTAVERYGRVGVGFNKG